MKFEFLTENEYGIKIYARVDEDGLIRYTCTDNDPAYLRWLNGADEGGTL